MAVSCIITPFSAFLRLYGRGIVMSHSPQRWPSGRMVSSPQDTSQNLARMCAAVYGRLSVMMQRCSMGGEELTGKSTRTSNCRAPALSRPAYQTQAGFLSI